jgi:DNA polymerase elongation subunit (family B)
MDFYTYSKRWGSNILHRSISVDSQGKAEYTTEKVPYRPSLYVYTDRNKDPSEYTDLEGNSLSVIHPGDMKETTQFAKELEGQGMNAFGNPRFAYSFLDEEYPGSVEFDSNYVKVAYIDIETECENGFPNVEAAVEEVNAITLWDNISKEYMVFTTLDYTVHRDDVRLFKFHNEKAMLSAFVIEFSRLEPHIITGWYLRFFDIPYLVNRIRNIFGDKTAKKLSPFNMISDDKVDDRVTCELIGIATLDYQELYKKFTQNELEKYSLDFVCEHELGEKKLELNMPFHLAYKEEPQKFIEYNIKDVELITKLEDKLLFMDTAMSIAYAAKVNYNDVYTQVSLWDTITINYLKEKRNVLVPFFKRESNKYGQFEGAYVHPPKPGMYDWIVSFDINSLYPSLIMALNISPEKIKGKLLFDLDIERFLIDEQYRESVREQAIGNNSSVAGNSVMFSREGDGFLPEILDDMYSLRKQQREIAKISTAEAERLIKESGDPEQIEALKIKSRVYDTKQLATKLNLNSCFGVLGNKYFRWFDLDQAEGITTSGKLVIRWIQTRMDEYFNSVLGTEGETYAVYGDTDSVYVDFSKVAEKVNGDTTKKVDAMDKLATGKVEPMIVKWFEELCYYINADASRLVMKREVIGPSIFLKKKHYIVQVHDDEGVRLAEPKMKVMGISAVRSNTPAFCRKKIKEAIKILIDTRSKEVLDAFIDTTRQEYYNLPLEEMAGNTGIKDLSSYIDGRNGKLKKGASQHIRASYIHNMLVDAKGIGGIVNKIKDGDKIKVLLLHEQNQYRTDVVAFMNKLPEEFELNSYANKEAMFDLHFLNPVMRIVKVLGWTTSTATSLESFMA